MIKIEKGKYLKINDNCYLCNILKDDITLEYIYAVAIKSSEYCNEDHVYEIYGYGNTTEEAIIMALDELVNAALEGISFETFKDLEIEHFCNKILNKIGDIASSKVKLKFRWKSNDEIREDAIHAMIDEENCQPCVY